MQVLTGVVPSVAWISYLASSSLITCCSQTSILVCTVFVLVYLSEDNFGTGSTYFKKKTAKDNVYTNNPVFPMGGFVGSTLKSKELRPLL